MCKCLIIDDSPIFCSGLKSILIGHDKCDFVFEARDSNTAIKSLSSEDYDLVFLDMDSSTIDVAYVLKRLKSLKSGLKLVIISSTPTSAIWNIAVKYNADGYVAKSESIDKFITVISSVLLGFKVLPSHYEEMCQKKLSAREIVIMKHLLDGSCNKDIAEKLSISPKTVSTYKTRILNKYRVKTLIELVNVLTKENKYPDDYMRVA